MRQKKKPGWTEPAGLTTLPPDKTPMSAISVPESSLSDKAVKQIRRCGSRIIGLTSTLERERVRITCDHRACERCKRAKAARVAEKISERVEGCEDLRMVTLTRSLPDSTGAKALTNCSRKVSDTFKAAASIVRRVAHCWSQLENWRERLESNVAAAGYASTRQGGVESVRRDARRWVHYYETRLRKLGTKLKPYTYRSKYISEFDRDRIQSPGVGVLPPKIHDVMYIWAKEVTTGSHGRRWHVHMHVLVPDLAAAQLLSAAWQYQRCDHCHHCNCEYWQTDITEIGAGASGAYLGKYLAKAQNGTGNMSTARRVEVVRGMKGQRRYGAAGDWRPLGIRGEPPVDPVEKVSTEAHLKQSQHWETWEEFLSPDIPSPVQRELDVRGKAEAVLRALGEPPSEIPRLVDALQDADTARERADAVLETLGTKFETLDSVCQSSDSGHEQFEIPF